MVTLIIINLANIVLNALDFEHGRITRPQFHCYLEDITVGMDEEEFKALTDFLSTSVQVRKRLPHN